MISFMDFVLLSNKLFAKFIFAKEILKHLMFVREFN